MRALHLAVERAREKPQGRVHLVTVHSPLRVYGEIQVYVGEKNAVGGSVAATANDGTSHNTNAAPAMISCGPMLVREDGIFWSSRRMTLPLPIVG